MPTHYLCLLSSPAIDLLAHLNTSHHISGVSRLQYPSGRAAYRIRPRAPHLILPGEYSHLLHSSLHRGMGVHLVGRQAAGSSATLLSLSSASSPILQIISSTLNNTLRVEYQAEGASGIGFPGRNPFSRDEWVQLAVSLETDRVIFFVDCQEAVTLALRSGARINLQMPQDVVITLASTPGKKESKFSVSFSVRSSSFHKQAGGKTFSDAGYRFCFPTGISEDSRDFSYSVFKATLVLRQCYR